MLSCFTLHRHAPLHWRQRLAVAYLQSERVSFPTRVVRWLVRRTPTGAAIRQHCSKSKLPLTSVALGPETTKHHPDHDGPPPTLHFVTPPDAHPDGPTLLYFHGGGYVSPLRSKAHMPFILACAAASRSREVAILEYHLAPEHRYPVQLVQCLASVRYLLEVSNVPASKIILAGDSAGGQLVGAVLAHIAKPCPYAPALSIAGDRFKAALLVSPFTRLPSDTGSYATNDGKDFLNRAQVDEFKAAWGPKDDDVWANMCGPEVETALWEGVFAGEGRLVDKLMVTVGTAEIFLDDCRVFAKEHVHAETVVVNGRKDVGDVKGKSLVLVECEGEVHVQVALDAAVGYKNGTMMRAVMAWLAEI